MLGKERCASAAAASWRTALAALAAAAVLAGCASTPGSHRSGDPANAPPGESGITVFGDIDVGVTRQRTR